jgi:hypothetical protein
LKIGTVTHYYDKIQTAVVDLISPLHIGDHIRFSGSREFSQSANNIQIEHEQVEHAEAGETVGIKTVQPVIVGDEVIKTS